MTWYDPMTPEERLTFVKRIDEEAFMTPDRAFIVVECGCR